MTVKMRFSNSFFLICYKNKVRTEVNCSKPQKISKWLFSCFGG